MNLRRNAWPLLLAFTWTGCSESSAPPQDGAATPPTASQAEAEPNTEPSATAPLTSVDAAAAATEPPKIYDIEADGFAQIETALAEADASGKRVLLQFGANWCGWCHKLHHLFAEDAQIAAELSANYIVVLVDVDGEHNSAVDKKYGNPTQHGLPVIVVLDASGKQLTTQDTAKLEEGDHHDPAKVMAFLTKWSQADATAEPAASESGATDAQPAA
jgi:thiol-disulfide isomerase/thioredoxin